MNLTEHANKSYTCAGYENPKNLEFKPRHVCNSPHSKYSSPDILKKSSKNQQDVIQLLFSSSWMNNLIMKAEIRMFIKIL